MKKGALLVNVARAHIVDKQVVICQALSVVQSSVTVGIDDQLSHDWTHVQLLLLAGVVHNLLLLMLCCTLPSGHHIPIVPLDM